MSLASISKAEILKDRALMLARCRKFFADREVIEVDVPILSRSASVDAYIDLIEAKCSGEVVYLHSSPEYGMKRLLSLGIGDIYQISHVFRDFEKGCRHTAEFMMAEWYRESFSLPDMIEETLQFIRLFLPEVAMEREICTYKDLFLHYLGRYPVDAQEQDQLFSFEIEPQLGHEKCLVVSGFPKERAALAQLSKEGVAMRFEVFYKGVELANGYHELTDAQEQSRRIACANSQRKMLGKSQLPLDEAFIRALESGLPDCCGVAVGFDRLMMLRHQLEDIRDASSFFI